MNGQDFLRIIDEAFIPFFKELGFVMDEPSISGRFYRASFTASSYAVSVSYEPGDEAFFVLIFCLKNGQLSDIDDRVNTPRLADLTSRFMAGVSSSERAQNEAIFASIAIHDDSERLLLKAANELRLVLPKYIELKN